MGKEQNNEYYNKLFAASDRYHNDWENVHPSYKILWEDTIKILQQNNIDNVLDIGCGMGQMAELTNTYNIKYKGIDFSEYAIGFCKKRNFKNHLFECVDALKYHYNDEVKGYITHEFLEHVEEELFVLKKLKPNKIIIFSVPNFNDPGHVRWFNSVEEIISRYSFYIKDLKVNKVTPNHYLGWGYTK